jgi:hypothetical protein
MTERQENEAKLFNFRTRLIVRNGLLIAVYDCRPWGDSFMLKVGDPSFTKKDYTRLYNEALREMWG